MDNFVNFPDAVVVYANWFQFGPGDVVFWPRVESRMLMWCRTGVGTVTVGKQRFPMASGDYLILPWKHDIHYRADFRDPFMVAGVHVIPSHGRMHPVVFGVAHSRDQELASLSWRKNTPCPCIDKVIAGKFSDHPTLKNLSDYILYTFRDREPDEFVMRTLGSLFLYELQVAALYNEPAGMPLPLPLRQVMEYTRHHLALNITNGDLVDISGLSTSSLARLFRKHLDRTPLEWIQEERMKRACELLRTSRLSVAAIGLQVGYEDPFYFSKSFRKIAGISPLKYRKEYGKL